MRYHVKGFVAHVHDPGPAENGMRGGHYVAYVRRQGAWFAHIQTWKLAHAFGADSCGRIFLDTKLAVISRSLPGKELGFLSSKLKSWQRHKSQFIVSPPLRTWPQGRDPCALRTADAAVTR